MSNELMLKYGCNPNQKPSRVFMKDGGELPITVLCGRPGYINLLDALNGYQLVRELKRATGLPAATSFKHVSPAGRGPWACPCPIRSRRSTLWIKRRSSAPLACAYARGAGRGPHVQLRRFYRASDVCDLSTAS